MPVRQAPDFIEDTAVCICRKRKLKHNIRCQQKVETQNLALVSQEKINIHL